MYERTAEIYDLLNAHTGKDYAAEAARVVELIEERNPAARTLLDVACGTGRHLDHFQERFDVVGLEPAAPMRELAHASLPDVTVVDGDMRTFELDARFDAVTCLFSAVGYMLTADDLHAAIATMARHLAPGGVLVVEPWFHPGAWIDGHVLADAANAPGLAVTRLGRSTRDGTMSRFDFHFVVGRADGVEQFVEPHELRLWTAAEYAGAFTAAGLDVDHDEPGLIGRGLFIGRAPG
ncbi:MAG: class I SAM-dependent methyltransferase [Ilumatobacter sp.]|nr:class I SAM-dependent methyltransferase [Ilumatobacter sp.]